MTWKHFKRDEFACKCGCGRNEISDAQIDALDELRDRCGFPFVVTSGYRCPAHNQRVSSTGPDGPHTTGFATDIGARGMQALEIVRHALAMGVFTGIGLNQKGDGRFVHLDTLPDAPMQPRPHCWTY